MNVSRYQVSLGAVALVLSLAFPMGVLSLLSPATTGDQVDAADSIAVVSVEAMQVIPETGRTVLQLAVEHNVAGVPVTGRLDLVVDGRPPVEVGDRVLALLSDGPDALLGAYTIEKNPTTLLAEVMTPVTGMWTQGVGDWPPVDLAHLETAIRVRRGIVDPAQLEANQPVAPEVLGDASSSTDEDGEQAAEGDIGPPPVDPDSYEPNDSLAESSVVVLPPPKLITGMPLCITGLTLTDGDVDFFSFNAPEFSVIHAETRLPEGVTTVNMDLDTLMGLFDAGTGELLAWDDDSGNDALSHLIAPLPIDGTYAVAVESAPDTNLDFSGDEGLTTGDYDLKLELQRASFLTNFTKLVVGVSPDGTFIEDFLGFREIDGPDVLLSGAATDGWGMSYQAHIPEGLTSVNQGAGDHQGDPGFNEGLPLIPGAFTLGPFVDSNGFNRAGFAKSSSLVPYQLMPRRGVIVTTEYTLGLNQNVVNGTVELKAATTSRILGLLFSRIMDVDLFGSADPSSTSDDHFFWHFDPAAKAKAFAVLAGENVNTFTEPAQGDDDAVGDYQAALVIDNGDVGASGGMQETVTYGTSFALVSGLLSEETAKQAAIDELVAAGMVTWVVAVDQDPATPGLFTAFGAGLAGPLN